MTKQVAAVDTDSYESRLWAEGCREGDELRLRPYLIGGSHMMNYLEKIGFEDHPGARGKRLGLHPPRSRPRQAHPAVGRLRLNFSGPAAP